MKFVLQPMSAFPVYSRFAVSAGEVCNAEKYKSIRNKNGIKISIAQYPYISDLLHPCIITVDGVK